MTRISIDEALTTLRQVIRELQPGQEVVITENDVPMARLLPVAGSDRRMPRRPGTLQGAVTYMAPDFDAPLDEFKEYME